MSFLFFPVLAIFFFFLIAIPLLFLISYFNHSTGVRGDDALLNGPRGNHRCLRVIRIADIATAKYMCHRFIALQMAHSFFVFWLIIFCSYFFFFDLLFFVNLRARRKMTPSSWAALAAIALTLAAFFRTHCVLYTDEIFSASQPCK